MGNESFDFYPDASEPQAGPSWQRSNWPLAGGAAEDDLTQALDPMTLKAAIKASTAKAGAALDERALEAAASDTIRAVMLIRTYRVRGHLAADLDPLALPSRISRLTSIPPTTALPRPILTAASTWAATSTSNGARCAKSLTPCAAITAAR